MSIPIPPERIPPIAKEVADNKKMYAAIWWFGTLLITVAGFASAGDSSRHHHYNSDTAYDAGTIVGVGFWVLVLFLIGLRLWRIGRRAARAMDLATGGHTAFVLADKLLVAVDERGVSLPDATFKISGKHAAMLTALPSATLVAKDSTLPRG